MKVRAKLTAAEFAELRRMTRSWVYWPQLLLRHHTAIVMGLALMVATVAGCIYGTGDGSWRVVAAVWLVVGLVAAWGMRNRRKSVARRLARFNAKLPEFAVLESGGLRFVPGRAAGVSVPWSSLRTWREGRLLFLLEAKRPSVFPLAKSDLAPHEVELLRGTLTAAMAMVKAR